MDRRALLLEDLARAIEQAQSQGVDVIDVSGGQLAPVGEAEEHLGSAVRLCVENGGLIVAAADNKG